MYNAKPFVSRAIDSVLEQVGEHLLELIIIDDCSSDGTADFIRHQYGTRAELRMISSETNAGPGAARNSGIRIARGEWIAFIDADDAWLPGRLVSMVGTDRPGVDMVFDNLIAFDQAIDRTCGLVFKKLPRHMSIEALMSPSIAGSVLNYGYMKPIVSRRFLEKTGVEFSHLRANEDLIFFLELLAHRPKAAIIAEANYIYTTPVGFLSRRPSLHSSTIANDPAAAHFLEMLVAKYWTMLNDAERDAITSRASHFYQNSRFANFYQSWVRREYWSMLRQCVQDADVSIYLLSMLRIRLRRLSSGWFKRFGDRVRMRR